MGTRAQSSITRGSPAADPGGGTAPDLDQTTYQDAVSREDSYRPNKRCVRCGRTLAPPGEHDAINRAAAAMRADATVNLETCFISADRLTAPTAMEAFNTSACSSCKRVTQHDVK